MNKKKSQIFIFCFFLCLVNLFSVDEDEIFKLRQEFVTANVNMKQAILEKIYKYDNKEYTILYIDALNYIKNHYELIGNHGESLKVGILAINKLQSLKEKTAIPSIRYLFSTVENEDFQIVCLKALSQLIEKNESFTNYLNTLYDSGLSDLINGRKCNIKLLIAYSDALGKFASQSSFDVLFKTLLYPVDENLKTSVESALKNIFFDYSKEILERMKENDLDYIYTLYSLACENKQMNNQKLGEISAVVLRFALTNFKYNSIVAQELILKTLPIFSKLKWSNVSKEINEFFYIAQTEWKQKAFKTEDLIKLIDCMGNIGTLEMAQSLSIFLGLINSQTEKNKQYSEDLLLSIINSLRKLGSKTAFDYLLSIEYLSYSDRIKYTARQAIKELKW